VTNTGVVVAGLLRHEDKVFVQRRRYDDRWYPGCWEFPGGKVEESESLFEAVCREVEEETGAGVNPQYVLTAELIYTPDNGRYVLVIIHCDVLIMPYRFDGEDGYWCSIENLNRLTWVPGEAEFIKELVCELV
jgi:8-oxo-dGTP diphosphatase